MDTGLFFLALVDGQPQGTIRFHLSDVPVWPEITGGDSAFVHRLAIRRAFAGRGLSSLMLGWAAERATSLGRRWLRLDCEVGRPKLRAFYESLGFRYHSDAEVETYRLSRFELDLLSEAGVQLERRSWRTS